MNIGLYVFLHFAHIFSTNSGNVLFVEDAYATGRQFLFVT